MCFKRCVTASLTTRQTGRHCNTIHGIPPWQLNHMFRRIRFKILKIEVDKYCWKLLLNEKCFHFAHFTVMVLNLRERKLITRSIHTQ